MKSYFVYILASAMNGTLYIGVTSDFDGRMFKHHMKYYDGFTKKYNVMRLVYFEEAPDIESAIVREKQLKNWHRDWKKNLIERDNPHWDDLYVRMMSRDKIAVNEQEDQWILKQVQDDKVEA